MIDCCSYTAITIDTPGYCYFQRNPTFVEKASLAGTSSVSILEQLSHLLIAFLGLIGNRQIFD